MIRISTSTLYDTNTNSMNQLQSNLLNTQLHVSSGLSVMTPADNPAAAAQVINVTQSNGVNSQFAANLNAANTSLTTSESVLQNVTTQIQNIQSEAVSAGNASLNNSDRQSMATNLQSQLNQLISLANSQDGNGNYLFSGTAGNTQPFAITPTGVQYQGNDQQQFIQVASNQQMPVNATGSRLFMQVKNGNGYFVTSAGSANTGSGVISSGNLGTPPPTASQASNSYTITFSSSASGLTYTVTGTDATGAALPAASLPPANQTFVTGQTISFNGIQFNIQGTPASGDTFSVTPSTNVSVFQTVQNLVNALNTPVTPGNPASSTALTQAINTSLGNLNQALNQVINARATIGSNLSSITTLQAMNSSLGVQYQSTIAQLQDLNYTQAITQLTQQQQSLQAAMKSFQMVSGLSLFNYM